MIVSKKGNWLTAKIGEELVMMSAEHGQYIGLSEVGARIWDLLETPQDVEQLCAQLVTEFDVPPETCRSEVEAFLQSLAQHDALALDPAPAA